jgi:hypothetical protein
LRLVVLTAWKQLQRIRREQAALAELPIAALQALTANINRDPKKSKAFTAMDFAMYRERNRDDETGLPADVAAVALALRHEDKASPILLTVWPAILKAAATEAKVPDVRALRSDDEAVWVLCPRWEGTNIRGGLVAVSACKHGSIKLRDIDRPLATYTVNVPRRPLAGWLEAGLLLVTES